MNSEQLRLRWKHEREKLPRYDLETYATVAERLAMFWQDHPLGSVRTHPVMTVDEDKVRVFAEIYRWNDVTNEFSLLASGQAEEERKGYVNEVAAVENCETSAVGRALALAGYGIKKGIASQEEIALAERRRRARTDSNGDLGDVSEPDPVAPPESVSAPEGASEQDRDSGTDSDTDADELVKQIIAYCGNKQENPDEFAVRREFVRAKLMSLGVDNPVGVRESVILLTEQNRVALREWLAS